MPLEIVPEPEPEERVAITTAVAALAQEEGSTRGAWWRAGIDDALAASDEGPPERKPPARA